MVQLAPAFRVVPQLPPPVVGREKTEEEKLSAIVWNDKLPSLVSVRVLEALFVFCATEPKFSGPPVTITCGAGGS